jgi:dolichol-phosphate mannosyltransferase
VLRFSRNFGHQAALTAGLDAARGCAAITLDADLQDPPELIPLLVAQWRQGAEIAYAQHARRRGETLFKRLTASIYYRLLGGIGTIEIPRDTGDFRLLDRCVVDVLVGLREQHRYLRGLSAWVGFRQVAVPFERPARLAGTTKFSLGKMLRLAADGILGFSYAPLEMATSAGITLAALTLLTGAGLGILALLGWQLAFWWAIVLPLLFLGAVQLVCVGMLGAYLGRVYDEVRARPRYILRETIEGPAAVSRTESAATARPSIPTGASPTAVTA